MAQASGEFIVKCCLQAQMSSEASDRTVPTLKLLPAAWQEFMSQMEQPLSSGNQDDNRGRTAIERALLATAGHEKGSLARQSRALASKSPSMPLLRNSSKRSTLSLTIVLSLLRICSLTMIRMTRWSVSVQPSLLHHSYGTLLKW